MGVSQRGFTGVQVGQLPDMFIPVTMQPQIERNSDPLESHRYHWLAVIGRLRPEVTPVKAEAALQVMFHPILESEVRLEGIPPEERPQFLARKLVLENGSHGRPVVQRYTREPLIMLTAMAGLVLIIACANLAGLLVARGESRRPEIAVRLSLGASASRVLRQLLTEGVLLSMAGGLGGLAVAPLMLRTIFKMIPYTGLNDLSSSLNVRLLLAGIGLALGTVILFALAPALRLVRTGAQRSLTEQSNRASAGVASIRLRKLLMISQMVFTTVLLAGAGLFTESLINVRRVNLGLNPDHVMQFSIAPELNGSTPERTVDLLERLRKRIATFPGVVSVSAAETAVLANSSSSGGMTVEGYTPSPNDDMRAGENWVGPNYFSTLGIPLLAGREFRESDTEDAPKVAIINEKLAQKYFAGRDPLGQHIIFRQGNVRPDIEIVGVVRDSKD
ncbi:MAG: ABC transporter permease, partial [Actinomycetota bacterium]